MAQWDNYSTKAAPADSDTMMIKDNAATGKPNKRVLFSGLWDWIVSKLANAVISSLTTNPKTVIGGMNALQTATNTLNSNITWTKVVSDIKTVIDASTASEMHLWSSQVDATAVSAPTNAGFFYIVNKINSSTVTVIAYKFAFGPGDSVYVLYKYGGDWGETWVAQPARAEVDALNNNLDGYFPLGEPAFNAADLNTVKKTAFGGCYRCTNIPSGLAADDIGVLSSIKYSKDWISQTYHSLNTGKMFFRRYYGGNTWSAWVEYANQSDITLDGTAKNGAKASRAGNVVTLIMNYQYSSLSANQVLLTGLPIPKMTIYCKDLYNREFRIESQNNVGVLVVTQAASTTGYVTLNISYCC